MRMRYLVLFFAIAVIVTGIAAAFFRPRETRTGRLYTQHCAACHDAGAGGAPTVNAKQDWAIRRFQTEEDLLRSVRRGFVGMPPSGRCYECSDQDLIGIIRYLRSGV
jgi:cytochrome c5